MAKQARKKTIGETEYTVYQLQPIPAISLLLDIAAIAGPGLAPVLSQLGSLANGIDREIGDIPAIGDAIAALTKSLRENKPVLLEAIKTLSAVSTIGTEGKEAKLAVVFDAHFAGTGIGELFQWLVFAVSAQYEDFLGSLASVLRSAPRQVPGKQTA